MVVLPETYRSGSICLGPHSVFFAHETIFNNNMLLEALKFCSDSSPIIIAQLEVCTPCAVLLS
jgi:hypothetical protein